MVRVSRRKGRRAQSGVQAIFSGRSERKGNAHVVAGLISIGTGVALWLWIIIAASISSPLLTSLATLLSVQGAVFLVYSLAMRKTRRLDNARRFASYELEDEIEPSSIPLYPVYSRGRNHSTRNGNVSPFRIGKILLVVILAGIVLTTVVGFGSVDLAPQHRTGPGSSGTGTKPPVGSVRTMAPSFYAVSNIAEAIVSSNHTYTGAIGTNSDDFIVVQIAYSGGSGGNLPNISSVTDTQSSVYSRAASASPGVAANFWEQAWTGRASSPINSTVITVSPDWAGCQTPCVTSIIITMTVGQYRGVAGVGASSTTAPSTSSNSQSVSIIATQVNSTLVELLSHGAYDNCGIDAPQPDVGQTSRNCFTATTERTELFDHSVTNAQAYIESYTWAQIEVQRGIYLELKGTNSS